MKSRKRRLDLDLFDIVPHGKFSIAKIVKKDSFYTKFRSEEPNHSIRQIVNDTSLVYDYIRITKVT